jgi:Sigma-70, region 4
MNDLLVVSKFKNLKLYELMAGKSAAETCREIGIGQAEFGRLINLRCSPFLRTGEFSKSANTIAGHFKVLAEDLFPKSLYSLVLPKEVLKQYSSEELMLSLDCREVKMLASACDLAENFDKLLLRNLMEPLLHTLSPRQEQVIRMRFGIPDGVEQSLEEVAEVIGTGSERVRQIEAAALRRFRHPMRSKVLRPFTV